MFPCICVRTFPDSCVYIHVFRYSCIYCACTGYGRTDYIAPCVDSVRSVVHTIQWIFPLSWWSLPVCVWALLTARVAFGLE